MSIVASGQISLIDLNDSKQLQLYISCNQPKTQIYDPNTGSYTPNWSSSKPVLTPQLFVAGTSTDIISSAKSVTWYEGMGSTTPISSDDTKYTIGTTGAKSLTINTNILTSINSQMYVCQVVYTDPDTGFDITIKADFEFVKVTNGKKGDSGASAIIGVLSNESASVPADSSGNVLSWTTATTTLTIYNGSRDDTANWTITQTLSGVGGTASGTPANSTFTANSMTADTATVTFKATRGGYSDVTKVFTITKSKSGSNGSSPTSYWLVTNASAIQRSNNGAYTPPNITVSGMSQIGASAPSAYNTYFKIYESTDGTNFTAKYTSTANEASYQYPSSGTFASGLKALKVEMYQAGGTTKLLDQQIIPFVFDGAQGEDSVVGVVNTPDGNITKNSTGSLTASMTVYKGGSAVSASAYKWYIQDPTATTSSGGDADGGAGWRLLNSTYTGGTSGYTTSKLTIPATAIAGVESFKCVATYNGKKYEDVCTVTDIFDPVSVTIIGNNVFKNGEGSTTLTAKVYQNGAEIDADGKLYTYKWSLYNSDDKLNNSFSKTGKTITVDASIVNGRANIICEISK